MPDTQAQLPAREPWREVAPGVLVRRHHLLDLNTTLVLGRERCLLVDTHAHDALAVDLLATVRELTSLPLVVANTHAHFDHSFGNAAIAAAGTRHGGPPEIWGHPGCRRDLRERGETHRAEGVTWMLDAGRPEDAAAVAAVTLHPPTRTVSDEAPLDLGGRAVLLLHAGRGHTDHDLVVHVPDAGVTAVGDLVEEGAPPAFEDSYPLEWPSTLDALVPRLGAVVVPGHGAIVDPGFVAAQALELREIARRARELLGGSPSSTDGRGLPPGALTSLPLPPETAIVALRRALETAP